MPSDLPKLERLRELRATLVRAWPFTHLDARCPLEYNELLSLLDAAIALRRLEEYLGLHERINILYVVDGYSVELTRGDGDVHVAEADAPAIFAALTAALDKAEKEGK